MALTFPNDELPYFEDRIINTNTRRVDWLVGYNAMAAWLDITPHAVRNLIAEGDLPVEIVQPVNGGNSKNTHTYIALKSKLREWEEKQKEKQQLPLQLIAPPSVPDHQVDDNLLQRLIKEQQETNSLLRSLWGELRELVTLWRGQQP